MNWIRIAVGIGDDPRVHAVADALDVRIPEAVGLVVMLLTRFPEHAPDGSLDGIPDASLERWSGWGGARGAFARAIRDTFTDEDGTWAAWEKYNGAALRESASARERARKSRKERGSGNGSPDGSANGSANGQANGSPLRSTDETYGTNERTDDEEAAPLAERFVHEDHRTAYLDYRADHRHPPTFDAAVRSVAEPIAGGQPEPWDRIGAALFDMRAAGATFSRNALAGFIRKLPTNGESAAAYRARIDADIAAGKRGELF